MGLKDLFSRKKEEPKVEENRFNQKEEKKGRKQAAVETAPKKVEKRN